MWQRRLITVFVIFLLITSFVVGSAQDEVPAETTPEVTQEPAVLEEPPAPEITEEPTVTPTEEPATPEATEESPTEAPQEGGEPPTPEVTNEPGTQEPAPVSAPPVFEIATSLSVTAGQSISIPFAIYDEQGAVVLTEMVSAAGAQTTLEIVAPIQVSPPYATTGMITYTASISDTLMLTAVDGTGLSASVTIQIDVQPAPEATAEATPEVTPEITQEPAGNLIERIISYDPAASEQAIQDMLTALHATEISRIPQLGSMKVLMPELLVSVAQTMAESNSAPAGLSGLEENVMYELFFTPNDPAFNNGTNQWPLTDYIGSMYTMYAWDIAKQDGAGVLVAVLDTGVDLQHPDLAGQIDTARDWDFINDDNNADDDHDPSVGIGGHGTHVAGIIAAKTNNGLYMAGIAYRAKILPVKVCTANTGCPTYEIAAGIVYAVDQGAKIINLSLGAPTISTTIRGAVEYALARNVTVVAAAGNAGTTVLQYPASYPGVISVASHDINGVIVSNSSHNNSVTISAPGYAVYSLARVEEGASAIWYGTSSAAANVSGVAALLYADNIARTPAAIREVLICTAADRGAVGYDEYFGYGMVQADWAMTPSGCQIPQPNDLFQNATEIKKVPFSITQPVSSRSVTTTVGDPTICFTPTQSLWYKFIAPADGRYQVTTYGSSYGTYIGVFQGTPNEFLALSCGGPWFDPGAFVTAEMKKGQTYYILVASSGAAVDDQLLQLDIRASIATPNKTYQESDKAIAYVGDWQRVSAPGASGGKVMQTFNDLGLATFSFRGVGFDLGRVVGPDQGSMEIWMDDALVATINNRAPLSTVELFTIFTPSGVIGQWHTVTIRREAAGPAGPVAIDTVRPFDTTLKTITAKTDDRDLTRMYYPGGWGWTTQTWDGAYKNTISRSTTPNSFMMARVTGNTINIYRNIGPGYGNMHIFIDGAFWGTVNNNFGVHTPGVPFTITNLPPTEHVLQLQNDSVASIFELDAIEGVNISTLAPNKQYSVGDKKVMRSNLWTTLNTPAALAKKTYVSNGALSWLDFRFSGDTFCVAFNRRDDGGGVGVYVDDMSTPYAIFYTNGGSGTPPNTLPGTIQRYCTGAAFTDGVHHVRLVTLSNSPVELDYVHPGRYGIITAKSGLVQENDNRIVHTPFVYGQPHENSAFRWQRIQMSSPGGAKPQGGFVKRVSYSPPPIPPAVIRFYINGSGFIIYTSTGPNAGELLILSCEPASICDPANIILNGTDQSSVVVLTTAPGTNPKPLAYAVTGLGPGIHEIVIYAILDPNQYVDFDGVRVLP